MFLCLFLLNFQFIFPIFQYLFLVCIQRCAINPAFPPDYLNIKMLGITMLFAGFKHFLRTHFKAHFVETSKMWKHRMSKCIQLRVNVSGSFVCKSFSPIVAIENVILFSIPSCSAFARSNAHEMQLKFKSTLYTPNIKFNNSVYISISSENISTEMMEFVLTSAHFISCRKTRMEFQTTKKRQNCN